MPAKRIIDDIDPTAGLETSWVRRGANPMAKVFLKKSADQPVETFNMLKSVAIAALLANPVGAALAKSFTEDAQLDAFLAKDDAGQTAELEAFAKANKMPFGEDTKPGEAKKGADTLAGGAGADVIKGDATADAITKAIEGHPIFAELKKQNDELTARLEKAVTETTTATLEKRAKTEFKGIGKSADEMVVILKALDSVDPVAKAHIEDVFKAHAKLAALTVGSLGVANLGKSADSAWAQLEKMAKDAVVAAKSQISFQQAFAKICDDPANAELVEKADAEENAAKAA
jgi:hypothetical protein